MRKLLSFLIFIMLFFSLTGCFKKTTYDPEGEVYVKTPSAHGDEGLSDVVDIEILKESYDISENKQIPIKVGVGHTPSSGGYDSAILVVAIIVNEKEVFMQSYEYDDFYQDTYNSTVPNNSSFLVIPFYDNFYPQYHEYLEIIIPEGINSGLLKAELRHSLEDDYGFGVELEFEIDENNILTFKK